MSLPSNCHHLVRPSRNNMFRQDKFLLPFLCAGITIVIIIIIIIIINKRKCLLLPKKIFHLYLCVISTTALKQYSQKAGVWDTRDFCIATGQVLLHRLGLFSTGITLFFPKTSVWHHTFLLIQ